MATRKRKISEDDFAGLEVLAQSVSPESMRPLSPAMRRRWKTARRGRPRKPAETKAVPTMITVDPKLLKRIDAHARKAGLSRSQFLADAAKSALRRAG